jgi:hypothetical protein
MILPELNELGWLIFKGTIGLDILTSFFFDLVFPTALLIHLSVAYVRVSNAIGWSKLWLQILGNLEAYDDLRFLIIQELDLIIFEYLYIYRVIHANLSSND